MLSLDKMEAEVESEPLSGITALIPTGGAEHLRQAQALARQKATRVEIMRRVMVHKLQQMQNYALAMREEMGRINKIVGLLELYLGVNEEIVQIYAGQPAPAATPIYIRQLVLYMDEEEGL